MIHETLIYELCVRECLEGVDASSPVVRPHPQKLNVVPKMVCVICPTHSFILNSTHLFMQRCHFVQQHGHTWSLTWVSRRHCSAQLALGNPPSHRCARLGWIPTSQGFFVRATLHTQASRMARAEMPKGTCSAFVPRWTRKRNQVSRRRRMPSISSRQMM